LAVGCGTQATEACKMSRSATIVAKVDCAQLELGAAEFRRVCDAYSHLKKRVEAEAARRAAALDEP
jgi:CRP-like cAMP-binding protein